MNKSNRSMTSLRKPPRATQDFGAEKLVLLHLQSLAVKKKNFFFVQILGGKKTLKNSLKSAGEILLSGLRGANHFSNTFRIVFWIFFSRFSNRSSYRFKSLSGAVSFCRHAALTEKVRKESPPRAPKSPEKSEKESRPNFQTFLTSRAPVDSFLNSVQTRCIVKGEAQKSPLFW